MTVKLNEYHFQNGSYVSTGVSFTFNPEPSSIKKTANVTWRVRHAGIKELKKAKWRYRRAETITLDGILQNETDRLKLEALATRNSKFTLDLGTRFQSPANQSIDDGSSYPPSATTSYFVITDFSCNQVPGKTIFEYTLKLERVEL